MNNKNTSKPLVSIALAVFNGEEYLSQQLDSLCEQTYPNFEIVITDDGSTDGTQDILDKYSKLDSRIRWSRNTQKRGMVSNFGEAVSLAKGEIIFLCDCDDVWFPKKIESHILAYQDPNIKWVYNNVIITDDHLNSVGRLTDSIPDYWTRYRLLDFTWGSCVIGCATSYRAKYIRTIWPAGEFVQGHDAWIQLNMWPAKRYYIDEELQFYRQHDNNTVGLKQVTGDEFRIRENLAIKINKQYLFSLAMNSKVIFWKRSFFFLVWFLKKIRDFKRWLINVIK